MVDTAYHGEGLLLRWGESNSAGRTVTFQLEEDMPHHPFKGYPSGAKNGQRFVLAVVPIANDQLPDEDTAAKVQRRRFADMPRSQQAGMLCADPEFQEKVLAANADQAAERVRRHCRVASRSELDTDKAAAKLWDNLVSEFEQRTGRAAEQR